MPAGIKYYERTKWLIELIKIGNTGDPKTLARKFNVSERTIYRLLDDLKFSENMLIEYSPEIRSYIIVNKM